MGALSGRKCFHFDSEQNSRFVVVALAGIDAGYACMNI
jgi:hypothetical protein